MNFIVELLSSKYKGNVYDFILVMVNQYIKMIQYLLINIIIKSYKLDDFLMKKVFFYGLNTLMSIILNRDSVFISDY